MANAGSLESISIRGRLFPVAADADAKRKLGGFEVEVQANGDGSARYIHTRVPWSLSDITISVDDTRADQEFLQEIADGPDEVPIVITQIDGVAYQAKGKPTGELSFSTMNATCSLSLSGGGKAEQQ
jgi:hypothetical protein